ncbi:DNA mismatch repair protein MutL [Actinoplanes sp. CA-015351]|uniref:DNA mismatch repair protein MutL n=1 Tax=Actinoplanes sp. CA-015351 TaxID=3239897 RepID=UPI003D95DEFB
MPFVRSTRWVPIAGWCLATATSIVLSSFALSPVLNAAKTDVGALPDLGQVPAAEVAVTTTTEAPSPTATEPSLPEDDESAAASATPSRTSRKPTSKPATADPTAPATTKPTAAATTTRPTTTTEDGWTVTTSDDGVKTYVKTFTTDGGRAVIKMISDGTVYLVTATPADGYTVQKNGSDVNLAVYFNETGHSFIIHAQWFNGAPFVEVSEVGE